MARAPGPWWHRAAPARRPRIPDPARERPAGRGEWRLAGFLAVSMLLHLLAVLDWGPDSGRRPAQAPAAFTARLAPAADEPLVQSVLAVVQAGDRPAELPPGPAPVDPPRAAAPAVPPSEVPSAAPPREAVEPPAAAVAPQAGAERAGSALPNWYTGRDLDVLPMPRGPVEPVFPLNAQLQGVSGKVTLELSIDPTGRLIDLTVVSADPPGFFEESARAALSAVAYSPGMKDGRPVRSRIRTTIVFEVAVLFAR